MDFQEILRRRRMVRSFLDRPLDPQAVERILDCGRRGPSAGFSQGFEFLVLEGPEQTGRYWDATWSAEDGDDPEWAGLRLAPLIIVPVAHRQAYLDRYAEADKGWTDKDPARWPVPYWLVDSSFAALLILLAVVDESLGALFFSIDDLDGFRRAFGVPPEYEPIGVIAVGHPATGGPSGSAASRPRRHLDGLVHRGAW